MLVTEQAKLQALVADLAQKHGCTRSSLIPILQEVQEQYSEVSEFAMQVIADQLDIHPAEVNSVVSFYAFLDTVPKGRFVIRMCRTISCQMAGAHNVARQLENDLGIEFGETTADKRFTLEWANCLGMCDQGPAMLVNDKVYTNLTAEKVHGILEECRGTFGVHATAGKEH